MTYYNRNAQLINTLNSFLQYNPQEFFVVVVDDGSPQDVTLPDKLPFSVVVIKMKNKNWTQGDPAYNVGFAYALSKNPDIIITQNAECYHLGDIIAHAKKHVTDSNYIAYGCYSQGKDETPGQFINSKGASFDGESAWYCHPVYRPKPYHFCSAISAGNLRKINGFDERFSFGAGFDDDYLLHQIRSLGLEIYITTQPIVIHQWHEHNPYKGHDEAKLLRKNHLIFLSLIKDNNYRAKHIITADL
jgi:GT2 family glycosyltransferase